MVNTNPFRRARTSVAAGLLLSTALAGCASFPQLAAPARVPDPSVVNDPSATPRLPTDAPLQTRVERLSQGSGPVFEAKEPQATREQIEAIVGTGEVKIALPPQTLPEFVRSAFQDVLGLSVGLGPEAGTRRDIVAMATPASTSRADFFDAAQKTLKAYGLEVYVEDKFVLVTDSAGGPGGSTYFSRGRTIPDSISGGRQVVLYFPLVAIEAPALEGLVRDMADRPQSVRIQADSTQNALIMTGSASQVRDFATFLREIDRPLYANLRVARVQPAYWGASALADQLVEVLKAEGISAYRGTAVRRGINLVPIAFANQLLVFAEDDTVFERALEWVSQLDRPAALGDATSLFVYEVRNTSAESLGVLLGAQAPASSSNNGGNQNSDQSAAFRQPQQGGQGAAGGQVTIDTGGNRLIFRGTATEFERILNTVRVLDIAPKQVMVEVTIAEVTLTDQTRFGIEWFGADRSGDFNLRGGTQGGLELGGSGFSLTVTGAKAQAALNALASNNKVNILSTPRLMAQSGGEASIQLGTDIPIITSRRAGATTTNANTDVVQTVEYRQTGIQLTVKPVVYADDRIDIEMTQSVSSATGSTSAATSNPLILNRTVNTRLSMREGLTAVVGGLMSENFSKSNQGIPFLKDIPGIGSAFRTDTVDGTKTELLILVTPRLLEENGTDGVNSSLISSMNQSLRLSRRGSYTLTPIPTGISIGGGEAVDTNSSRPPPRPRDEQAGKPRPEKRPAPTAPEAVSAPKPPSTKPAATKP